MRDILFRGKRKDNGEWVEGYYAPISISEEHGPQMAIVTLTPNEYAYLGYGGSLASPSFYMVDPNTVGQYTGLLDMNGKKIFEGDIVRDNYGLKTGVRFFNGRYYPFIVYPEYNCWNENECKIVGNIHDNPELL